MHEVRVTYTSDDDGVWLSCECGWSQNLGFSPVLVTLFRAGVDHYMEVR
jgi:hypothetical protein